jgi:hypothetical protein
LALTRWLCTIWRYSKPPDRLVRKYVLAYRLPAQDWGNSSASQAGIADVLALQKRPNSGFATAECGFQPHFERGTVKVRCEPAAQIVPDRDAKLVAGLGEWSSVQH